MNRALGSPTSGKEVHVDYTMVAVKAFQTALLPELKEGQPFRFVYTSGGAVPYLDSKILSIFGEKLKVRVGRLLHSFSISVQRVRGLTNNPQGVLDRDLLAIETQNPGRWETFVVRPWFVVDVKPYISYILSNSWIYRKELGAAMVDAALNSGEERVINNAELRVKGQAALKLQP